MINTGLMLAFKALVVTASLISTETQYPFSLGLPYMLMCATIISSSSEGQPEDISKLCPSTLSNGPSVLSW